MKTELRVNVTEEVPYLMEGITYASVPFFIMDVPNKDLKLNVMRRMTPSAFGSEEKKKSKQPLFVWICGGAWMTSDRNYHMPWLMNFVKAGFVVASVDYRLSNNEAFPGALCDVKAAIRYLRAHADLYGIDTEHVFVGGESAGGYLANIVGVTGKTRKYDVGDYLDQSSAVAGVLSFYGLCDFTLKTTENPEGQKKQEEINSLMPPVSDVFMGFSIKAHPEKTAESCVLNYITPETPPFFIAHGSNDFVVNVKQSDVLYDKLEEKAVKCAYYRIEGAEHGGPEFYQEGFFELIKDFFVQLI